MLLLSGREANLVGDVAEEIAKATDFLAGGTAAALGDDQLRLYAVEKAVMNAIEASIRLQRENNGRFELVFRVSISRRCGSWGTGCATIAAMWMWNSSGWI
jgi:hypothetical protein